MKRKGTFCYENSWKTIQITSKLIKQYFTDNKTDKKIFFNPKNTRLMICKKDVQDVSSEDNLYTTLIEVYKTPKKSERIITENYLFSRIKIHSD